MEIIKEIKALRAKVSNWKKQGLTVGLVPTMGALHAGHESLIKKATESCDKVVVSIFVNPIQFGPNEDYDRYPRQLDKDAELCSKIGADLIFAPAVEEMYPEIKNLTTVIPHESLKNKLCGKTRKGHFDGVATVVLKLFNIVQPDRAFFGQKDAQQLIIIKKMVRDLNIPVEITACPIIREQDGLALSSRNAYLSPEARQKALSLSRILNKIEELYNSGLKSKDAVFSQALKLADPDVEIEYLDLYDAMSLESINELKPDSLIAIAAKVSDVRLIDNIIL